MCCCSLLYEYVQYSNCNVFYKRYCNAYNSQANYSAVFQIQRPSKGSALECRWFYVTASTGSKSTRCVRTYRTTSCSWCYNAKYGNSTKRYFNPRDRHFRRTLTQTPPADSSRTTSARSISRQHKAYWSSAMCRPPAHCSCTPTRIAEGDRKYPLNRGIRAAQTGRKQPEFRMENALLYVSVGRPAVRASDALLRVATLTMPIRTERLRRRDRPIGCALFVRNDGDSQNRGDTDPQDSQTVQRVRCPRHVRQPVRGTYAPLRRPSRSVHYDCRPEHSRRCNERLLAATAQELMALSHSRRATDALVQQLMRTLLRKSVRRR